MPTIKQLHRIWECQFEFFGGAGIPKQNYEGVIDENGLTKLQLIDTPLRPKSSTREVDGKVIGKISFDKGSKDLHIVVTDSKITEEI